MEQKPSQGHEALFRELDGVEELIYDPSVEALVEEVKQVFHEINTNPNATMSRSDIDEFLANANEAWPCMDGFVSFSGVTHTVDSTGTSIAHEVTSETFLSKGFYCMAETNTQNGTVFYRPVYALYRQLAEPDYPGAPIPSMFVSGEMDGTVDYQDYSPYLAERRLKMYHGELFDNVNALIDECEHPEDALLAVAQIDYIAPKKSLAADQLMRDLTSYITNTLALHDELGYHINLNGDAYYIADADSIESLEGLGKHFCAYPGDVKSIVEPCGPPYAAGLERHSLALLTDLHGSDPDNEPVQGLVPLRSIRSFVGFRRLLD